MCYSHKFRENKYKKDWYSIYCLQFKRFKELKFTEIIVLAGKNM